jgi:putative heme-binding domain-containing protein
MGAVIALRRLASPELAKFLADAEEDIVTEVARAIHDDLSVPAAMPKLAALLATTPFTNEPLIRRVISANQRLGKEENLNYVLGYLAKPGVSEALKKESLATLGTWASPSVLDRVDGRYRGEVTRDPALVKQKVAATLELQAKSSAVELRRESIKAMGKLGMVDMADFLFGKLKTDPSQEVKVEALNSLVVMNASNLSDAIAYAMRDVSEGVRVAGLGLIAQTSLPNDQKVPLLMDILKKRTLAEKQTALLTLGSLEGSKDFKEWSTILEDFKLGKLPEGTWIELEESILATGSANLKTQYESLLDQKAGGEAWKKYVGALAPGNIEKGRNIFFQNQTAQCIRCHAYDDMGGNAGPALDNIGKTLSKEDLLIALVEPSKRLSPGYGSVTLTLVAGTKVTGLLLEDNKDSMRVKVGTEVKEIAKKDIASSALGASSMPPMGTLLTKRDIRDLVSYLSTLKRSE